MKKQSLNEKIYTQSKIHLKSLLKNTHRENLGFSCELPDEFIHKVLNLKSLDQLVSESKITTKKYLDKSFEFLTYVDKNVEVFIPIEYRGDIFYLQSGGPLDQLDKEKFLAYYFLIDIALDRYGLECESSNFLEVDRNTLDTLSFPIAYFNSEDELVYYNNAFIKLNISAKDCLMLENNNQTSINKNTYKVKRKEKNKEKLYYFLKIDDLISRSKKIYDDFNDLGIVTSSLAHELNNPFAGILAAIELLLLDDHPSEVFCELKEMKKTALRCKKIVEVFLGFSKYETNLNSDGEYDFKSSLDGALDLIKFRLIENNVTIEVKYSKHSGLEKAFNYSIITMILYLILGDIITLWAHEELVRLGSGTSLKLNVIEDSDSFELKILNTFKLKNKVELSNLTFHLLKGQKIDLDYSLRDNHVLKFRFNNF